MEVILCKFLDGEETSYGNAVVTLIASESALRNCQCTFALGGTILQKQSLHLFS